MNNSTNNKNRKVNIYDDESNMYYEKYYTTDPNLIKIYDKHHKLSPAYKTCGWLSLLSLFVFLFGSIAPFNAIFVSVTLTSMFSFLIAFLIIGSIDDKLYVDMINKFEASEEFEKQVKQRQKEAKEAHDKYLYEKSKDLVESYEILESKEYSKYEKIELLKSYIDRADKRR